MKQLIKCAATSFGLLVALASLPLDAKDPPPAVETLNEARPGDSNIVRAVAMVMDRQHMSKHRLDDEISEKAFNQFMKMLDPQKIYLLQEDIEEFSGARTRFDDYALEGDMDVAIKIFKRFLKRVDTRIEMAHKYIDQEHDFSKQEKIATDPDEISYPGSTAEANDRMRRLVKYRLLLLESDKIRSDQLKAGKDEDEEDAVQDVLRPDPNEDPRERLHRIYRTTAKRWHQTDADELLEMYVSAITTAFDPHTTFMSPDTFENFIIMMSLELDGIGAQLTSEDGYTKLTSIVPGGAADKDGRLKPGDRIIQVGQGEDGDMIDVVDMKLDDVVDKIRGTAGTVVRLGVLPNAGGEMQEYSIVRAKISLDDSAARGEVVEYGKNTDGGPLKFGYIDLPSFYSANIGGEGKKRSTTADVRKIINGFRKDNIDAVVLDLSRNGGGSLEEAINLTGLFIDRGPVVQAKALGGELEIHRDTDSGVAWGGPLIVMTSKGSASASEILAGAIQDYRRGIIVGDPQTHGKGTVQTLIDLGRQLVGVSGEMGALKLTIRQFYLPGGKSTQRQGVMSDIVLPAITASIDNGEADLPNALPNNEVKPVRHYDYNMVSENMLAKLRSKSEQRIEASEGFKKLFRRIELFEKQKEENFVSLNREDFLKRRAELDAEREETETLLESQMPKKDVFKMDYYSEEVLSIAKDYVEQLRKLDLVQAG
ncbi:MAG TPA: tail-specific protease [Planctomycetaceae bacterium]|nr:tail-specific protease [Planctomycetaceae bacterium]